MKKVVVTIAALGFTFMGMAQDKYVTSALTALNQKNYDEAKTDIDKAMESPETKEKPKALFAKAQIYYYLMQQEKYKSIKPYKDVTSALLKLTEVKPDYEKDEVNSILFYCAQVYYNEGLNTYNVDNKPAEAIDDLKYTLKIHDLNGGKRFEKFPYKGHFDTVAANADLTLARIAYAGKDTLETIRLLTKVTNNKITKVKDNYYILLQSYADYNSANNNKMASEEAAAMQEARSLFPDDANIRNMEINSFSRNGKQKDLVSKLEESAQKEPNNADVVSNLGLLYLSIASPKTGEKPANAADYLAKAETNLKKAVTLGPENAGFNFNLATLYFNQAYDYNEQMGAIPGNTDADLKKVDALKEKRDAMFEKAAPYFEKINELLSPKESSLKGSDAEVYRASIVSLKQIYIVQNKMDKAKELAAKIKAFDAKGGN